MKMLKPGEGIVGITCRSLAGTDLCSLEADTETKVGGFRRQLEKKLDPEDKTNVVLCIRTESLGKAQDHVKLIELLPASIDDVKFAFAKADSNKDGFLDKAEAKAMLTALADALPSIMSAAEIDQLFDAVDADADGRLNLLEFIDWCFGVQMIGESEKNSLLEELKSAA
ncbi:Calml3 [Symbiodinium sp. CCMP2456]|nr:Calml3 [Symbiodinium sp. CCMP2456]